MLDVFRAAIPQQSQPSGCHLIRGDVTAMPFADDSFDLVLSTHLLYLVDGWREGLAEIRRVLRPGGTYLHCFESHTSTPAAVSITQRWTDAIDQLSPGSTWQPACTDAQVLAALTSSGAMVGAEVAAHWQYRRSVADLLDGYADRVRPLYSAVADTTFTDIVDSWSGWVRRTFPLDTEVGHQVHFEVHAARWDR